VAVAAAGPSWLSECIEQTGSRGWTAGREPPHGGKQPCTHWVLMLRSIDPSPLMIRAQLPFISFLGGKFIDSLE